MSMAKVNLIFRPRSCYEKLLIKKKMGKEKTMKLTSLTVTVGFVRQIKAD